MPKYYYVVDTSITNDAGVAVGQTTYDLLVDERLSHGVVPETTGPGAGTTCAGTDSPPGTLIGIHTTRKVGIGGTALEDFNLKVHGSLDTNSATVGFASIGIATIGIATFGGTYETVRPNDKILSPTNNSVAQSNSKISIDIHEYSSSMTRQEMEYLNASQNASGIDTISSNMVLPKKNSTTLNSSLGSKSLSIDDLSIFLVENRCKQNLSGLDHSEFY